MKEIIKGENISINDIVLDKVINIKIRWKCINEIDVSIFMLDDNDKIKDNQDFIYFNNNYTKSIKLLSNNSSADISIDISSINPNITKLPIVITITDNNLDSLEFLEIIFNEDIIYRLDGISNEKSIILAEIYRRSDIWKYKILAKGFNDGLEKIAYNFGLQLDSLSQEEKNKTFRKSTKDIIQEHIIYIKKTLNSIKPYIDNAIEKNYNESDTRMIIDKIFTDVLGYSIDEIKTEQKIQGRRADYILSVNNIDYIVVEAKKAGMLLKEKQIFQATSYGAYSGIKWALLTNLNQWQLYYINSGDKIEPELVFCVDLNVIQDEDIEMLFKISKNGILRKGLLDKEIEKNRALSQANIISTLLMDTVLDKIRVTINKDSSYKVSNAEIQNVLEKFLNI